MTEFGDKLASAITDSKNDINRFTWKKANGESVNMMNMTQEELHKA